MLNEPKAEPSSISSHLLLPGILAFFLLLIPLAITVSQASILQQSDYESVFYLAGRLILSGRSLELYANQLSNSLMTTPFNAYAHQALALFPKAATAVFMYPPLTAAVFAPFALLSPTLSLLAWQIFSMVAFFTCAKLIAKLSSRRSSDFFLGGVLFLPVSQNFLLGQLGIPLGLMPLCVGYWCLIKGKALWAGLIFSLLWLKPQFLPVAALIVLAFALAGKFRCLAGFFIGSMSLGLLSQILFGPEVLQNWLLTLKLAGTIYSDPQYTSPSHLVSCLASAITQALPLAWRPIAKQALFGFGLVIAGQLLLLCRRLLNRNADAQSETIPFIFVTCISVLPLILPYLLFYDLSIFALAGMIIFSHESLRKNRKLMRDLILAWCFIDAYLVTFMFIGPKFVQPLFLILILALIYKRIYASTNAWTKPSPAPAT